MRAHTGLQDRLSNCARSFWQLPPSPHPSAVVQCSSRQIPSTSCSSSGNSFTSTRSLALERQQQQQQQQLSRRGGVITHAVASRSRSSPTSRLLSLPGVPTLNDIQSSLVNSTDLSELELRNVKSISYVSRRRLDDADFDANAVDADGLPLVYNEERIAAYWRNKPGELATRWARFAGISAPWMYALASAVLQGKLESRQADLARDAVINLEQLGPTFIKLGQILSIRPDVLPPVVMKELAKLQDRIEPFDNQQARMVVERELGAPIDTIFSEFSDKPVAAASLAQVYRARVRATGQEVAVKVQRPAALSIISKDLYVLRRAVRVYEGLVRRFTAQTTDYQVLLSTFAEGLYTEMDFRNEALNAVRMQTLLDASEFRVGEEVVIPKPLMDLTTRCVLTMEWITGVKLTTLPPAEIRALAKVGQTAFLTQLLEIGFFHGDPHPGNLLKVTEGPHTGKLCLLDFGLVAEIPRSDREAMVSATVHLANRDWDALIDDFVALEFLPRGSDRVRIIPVMERVLGPYLRGGGAKAFNFTALSQDLLSVTLEIPFSVPPYMSLLARSVATLEGIALLGDPNYQMVTQAYPFVVRKVLRNNGNGASALLREIIYDPSGNVKPTRLSALLNAALGYAADSADGFVDLDAVPREGASLQEMLGFLLSPEARELRPVLVAQLTNAADLVFRDRLRKAYALLPSLAPRLPFFGPIQPILPPVFVPGLGLQSVESLVSKLAPSLDQEEGIYLQSILQLAAAVLGVPVTDLDTPSLPRLLTLLTNPSDQVKDMRAALTGLSRDASGAQVAGDMASSVMELFLQRQAARLSLPVDVAFPMLPSLRRALQGRQVGGSTPAVNATTARVVSRPVPSMSGTQAAASGTRTGSGGTVSVTTLDVGSTASTVAAVVVPVGERYGGVLAPASSSSRLNGAGSTMNGSSSSSSRSTGSTTSGTVDDDSLFDGAAFAGATSMGTFGSFDDDSTRSSRAPPAVLSSKKTAIGMRTLELTTRR